MKNLILRVLFLVGITFLGIESIKCQTYINKGDTIWQKDSLLLRSTLVNFYTNSIGQSKASLLATEMLSRNLLIEDSMELGKNYSFLLVRLSTEDFTKRYHSKCDKRFLKIVIYKSFGITEILILSKCSGGDRKRFKFLSAGFYKSATKRLISWLD